MSQQQFERITIIGLGLIGSSVARAVRERHIAGHIVGCDHNEVTLAYGRKHGFIDTAEPDAARAVSGSRLVLIATPPSSLEAVARSIAPSLAEGCIVMDACSVKEHALQSIAPHLPKNVHYIPAHPIAGSEHSGISAGKSDLFSRKRVIVTPTDPTAVKPIIDKVSEFWRAMDAKVEAMPAHLHDLVYAYVSHLPQLLSFAAAGVLEGRTGDLADLSPETELLKKFLRISHSGAEMWIEIFLLNKTNLMKALNRYLDAVTHIRNELLEPPEDAARQAIAPADVNLAYRGLFPRVAASCLITTVMEAEKKAGFPFARFAGTGFADFTYPASQSPEGDIESISNQYQAVLAVLEDYCNRLNAMQQAIESGDTNNLVV